MDRMTPVMNRVTRSAQSAQRVVERANSYVQRSFKRSAVTVTGLRDKIESLRKFRDGLRIGIDDREIRRANGELSILQRNLDRLERRNSRADGSRRGNGMFGGIMPGGLAAGAMLYGALNVGGNALNNGMEMGKNEETFKAFVGNAEKANQILEKVKAYSQKYAVYDRNTVTESATRIASTFGYDQTMQITEMLGKLAMGDAVKYSGILGRLEQIKGTGYLQGDELNELMNQGVFGIQEEIAKFKNISLDQFNKLKESRQISYDDVYASLQRMTSEGGKFNDKLDVIMNTAWGKWKTITQNIKTRIAEVGFSASSGLTKAFDWIIRFMKNLKPVEKAFGSLTAAFKSVFNGIYRVGVAFGLFGTSGDSAVEMANLLANVLNTVAFVINIVGKGVGFVAGLFERFPFLKYAVGFLAIGNAINFMTTSAKVAEMIANLSGLANFKFSLIQNGFAGIATAMKALWANPVALIALGVIALGAAIYYAWNESETFRRVVIQTWEGLKYVWELAVAKFQEVWTKISEIYGYIKIGWTLALAYIYARLKPYIDAIVTAWNWLGDKIGGVVSVIKEKFSGMFSWLLEKAKGVAMSVLDFFTLGFGSKLMVKFGIGYDSGSKVADAYEKSRKAQELLDKGKAPGFVSKFMGATGLGDILGNGSPAGSGDADGGAAKASGISDTVKGSVSKTITINLQQLATFNQNFGGGDKFDPKSVANQVLEELNRVLLTGDRMAVE